MRGRCGRARAGSALSPPGPAQRGRARRWRAAVGAAERAYGTAIAVPGLGRVRVPVGGDEVGFRVGLGFLALVGALEWPVVLVLGVGRVLSHQHRWEALHAVGEALEHG